MTTDYQPDRDYPSLNHLVIGLLIVECMLWLSDRFGLPEWDKGHAVLAAVVVVGFVLFLTLMWFTAALLFRWPFQFSIRSLLLLAVAASLPFSWLAVEIQRAKRERQVVVEIENLGGEVTYDWQFFKGHIQDQHGFGACLETISSQLFIVYPLMPDSRMQS